MIQEFELMPFTQNITAAQCKITGCISRKQNHISVCYKLEGVLDDIVIPSPTGIPLRKKGLWEETCFELFINSVTSEKYWEINLSPSGHWNVYSFQSYRKDMKEETAFVTMPFRVTHSDGLHLHLDIDLSAIIPVHTVIKVAISAVILYSDCTRTYWSLVHPGQEVDFHRSDSFIVRL